MTSSAGIDEDGDDDANHNDNDEGGDTDDSDREDDEGDEECTGIFFFSAKRRLLWLHSGSLAGHLHQTVTKDEHLLGDSTPNHMQITSCTIQVYVTRPWLALSLRKSLSSLASVRHCARGWGWRTCGLEVASFVGLRQVRVGQL